MADRDGETGLIGQLLQFPFPQAHPRAVAASSVRADEQAFRLRILLLPHLVPPTSDALHGKGGRLMVDAHVDPAGIASQVVHPIRRRSPQALHGEVVNPHVLRFSLRVPCSPRVTGSTSRSRSSLRLGSLLTLLLRPPPILRIRPSPARCPSRSSCIPSTMTCRDSPVARATTAIPPQPSAMASLAAKSLRVRSFSSPASRSYRCLISSSFSMLRVYNRFSHFTSIIP